MEWYFYLLGIITVVGFFYFLNYLTIKWKNLSEKVLLQKIFVTALIIRVIWVIFSYFFYTGMNGNPFEFYSADSVGYDATAASIAKNKFKYITSLGLGIADSGYPFYLGLFYTIFGPSILLARLGKTLISAYTCVLIYRIGKRTFGDSAGRIAGIMSMLMPNLIYYCGLHLKETEMVFLCVFFIERADALLRSQKYTFLGVLLPLLTASALFTFRTVLGATAFFALVTALLFTSSKISKWRQRFFVGIWVVLAALYFVSGKIASEIGETWNARNSNQTINMEWRSKRDGDYSNVYAKYFSGYIFAPLIVSIPFPTVVNVAGQENQKLMNGSNFTKNVISFFTIFAIFLIIKNMEWRKYILILTYSASYWIIIAFSAFAHSERFHMPVLPFLLIFASYGISKSTNKTKKFYNMFAMLIFFAMIVWNWFKLSGRSLI
jgi:4-amino-4-deoxy-L-arabinose transferase-like glycosyltransferase